MGGDDGARQGGSVRTGSCTGPPQGKRAPRVGMRSTVIGPHREGTSFSSLKPRRSSSPPSAICRWYCSSFRSVICLPVLFCLVPGLGFWVAGCGFRVLGSGSRGPGLLQLVLLQLPPRSGISTLRCLLLRPCLAVIFVAHNHL